jgi:hypothetical protein
MAGNTAYSTENGVLYNKAKTTIISVPMAKSGEFTLPDTLTSIGNYAFWDCDGLTSVTIPGSVTSIGDRAFIDCDGLTTVIFVGGSNITTAWTNDTFSITFAYPTGTSLWNVYTTGSKAGTYTCNGNTWTQTR